MQQYTTFKLYKGSLQRLAQRLYHLKGILKGLPIVSWFNTHGSILEDTTRLKFAKPNTQILPSPIHSVHFLIKKKLQIEHVGTGEWTI